jgi:osmotically-inducible protein OsmY
MMHAHPAARMRQEPDFGHKGAPLILIAGAYATRWDLEDWMIAVRALTVVAAAGLSIAVGGCLPVVVGGAALGVNAVTQERGLGGAVSDAEVQAQVNHYWIQHDNRLLSRLDITVDEGRVLLTGRAIDEDMRADAVRLTWQAKGVVEVINEIVVDPSDSLQQSASDRWMTTRLRTALITDADIQNNNFSIVTVNGVVHLIGKARSRAELDKVLGHARGIPNVRRVVSYVRV